MFLGLLASISWRASAVEIITMNDFVDLVLQVVLYVRVFGEHQLFVELLGVVYVLAFLGNKPPAMRLIDLLVNAP